MTYIPARIQFVVIWRMKASNFEEVGQIRRRKGTSTKRIIKAETLLRVRIALSQGIWLDSQAQNGEDNVPTVKSKDVGNTESDA